MLETLRRWSERIFSNEETVLLVFILFAGVLAFAFLGDVLAPVITSAILAFMLQGVVAQLVRFKCPQWAAVMIAYALFMSLFLGVLFGLLPLVWEQLSTLAQELPRFTSRIQQALLLLPENYDFLTEDQIKEWMALAAAELGKSGQYIVSFSLGQIPNLFGIGVFLILVPILVFFFLKDKDTILNYLASYLPSRRPLMKSVWDEMNVQVANYVRGKAIEIVIVGGVSFVAFQLLDLNYAELLAIGVGLSVVIPYIGALVITLPVAAVGFVQWGFGADFYTLLIVYIVIQGLDGNVLVPLLFSEVVNLHPVAIIMSVLVFGGLWGLWGVFFAIPLATLAMAIIHAWPKPGDVYFRQ